MSVPVPGAAMAERVAPSGAELLLRLSDVLGPGGLLADRAARAVYARDASHLDWGRPLGVALPADAAQLCRVVALCGQAGVPVVPRGAGTGLSGGAVPPDGALVLGTARLLHLGEVDAAAGAVQVGAGVLNAAVTGHAAPWGLHFAPDPSSQAASTIGGNIAENAGGPHCLRFGVTTHHVRALSWCDADGHQRGTGPAVAVLRGLDLRGLLCGSEGTLGIVTGAWLQLVPSPAAVQTLLAFFPVLEAATAAVPRLLQAGLLPVAVEIIDRPMVLTVEEAFGFGLPTDVEAVMIAELAGEPAAVDEQAARAAALLRESGAREVRRAADAAERAALWQCRKRAFGAVGRLSPNYVSMDIVVPLGELPGLVREIQKVRERHGVRIATAFHAGDGNLHPAVHYDARRVGEAARAHAAADEIIRAALARRGSATGEHGVGLEKRHALPWQLDATTAALLHAIKNAFDPAGRLNPGKALPAADPPLPTGREVAAGPRAAVPPAAYARVPPVPNTVRCAPDDLTISAPAGASLAEVQHCALAHGLWLPLGLPGAGAAAGLGGDLTVAGAVDLLLGGPVLLARATARDILLEAWAETGDGRAFHAGAPVAKNVAGYDVARILCGSGGCLARLQAATFLLRPAPAEAWAWRLERAVTPGAPPMGAAARWPGEVAAALAGVGDGLAGAQVVLDAEAGEAWLLAAGPATGAVVAGRRLEVAAGAAWRPTGSWRRPFAAAHDLLEVAGCPGWSRGAPDWTALQPLPGRGCGAFPDGIGRLVWQDFPRVAWVPVPDLAVPGWHADCVIRDGRPSPLPAAPADVPGPVLRRLKLAFDPGGVLGGPAWLREAVDA